MAELVNDGDLRAIATPSLRLSFRWTTDRWIHAVEPGEGPARRPVAWSFESDPDRDDPARVVSPAYQQLEFQESPAGLQALLVGQSGPHHFSAVFTVAERPGLVEVSADVADRCRAPVEALACTYWVDLTSGDLIDAGSEGIQWAIGPGRLRFAADPPARPILSEAGRRATRVQADAPIAAGALTHRCGYRWTWQPAG